MRRRLLLSFVAACAFACSGSTPAPSASDAGSSDAGSIDAGVSDAGVDADPVDAGELDAGPLDGGEFDAGPLDAGSSDAGWGTCLLPTGQSGDCIDTSSCASMGGDESTPGYCPGPSNIECCAAIPNVADNPPIPSGWQLMPQADVTPDMTTWAVDILHDPGTYPMFASTTQTFGTQLVMARVEWHPPDFQNSVVHRGVTLYIPN